MGECTVDVILHIVAIVLIFAVMWQIIFMTQSYRWTIRLSLLTIPLLFIAVFLQAVDTELIFQQWGFFQSDY